MRKQIMIISGLVILSGTALGFGTEAIASAQSTKAPATANMSAVKKSRYHRVRMEAKLNQAVRDGTITVTQKTAFTAELKTLKQEREAALNKSSTSAQRQAERTKLKAELQSWATSHNFPFSKILPNVTA